MWVSPLRSLSLLSIQSPAHCDQDPARKIFSSFASSEFSPARLSGLDTMEFSLYAFDCPSTAACDHLTALCVVQASSCSQVSINCTSISLFEGPIFELNASPGVADLWPAEAAPKSALPALMTGDTIGFYLRTSHS